MEIKSGRKMDEAWKKAISEGLKKVKGGISNIKDSSIGQNIGTAFDRAKASGDSKAIHKSEHNNRLSVTKNRTLGGKIRMVSGNVMSKVRAAGGTALSSVKAVSKNTSAKDVVNKAKAAGESAIKKGTAAYESAKDSAGKAVNRFRARNTSSAVNVSDAAKRKSVNANRSTAGKLRMASGNAASKVRKIFSKG